MLLFCLLIFTGKTECFGGFGHPFDRKLHDRFKRKREKLCTACDQLVCRGQGLVLHAVVVMTGSNSEYIGYSGGTSALKNFQRSSAITINNAKKLNLDLHELKRLLINGYSYIYLTLFDYKKYIIYRKTNIFIYS